jgi:hypothetical protein
MSSANIATVVKMIESLPGAEQSQVIEHLRNYLEDIRDEDEWDEMLKKTQPGLVAAAQRAKREIAEGRAKPLDPDKL